MAHADNYLTYTFSAMSAALQKKTNYDGGDCLKHYIKLLRWCGHSTRVDLTHDEARDQLQFDLKESGCDVPKFYIA